MVLSDKGYDGAAANVWSCGVILFVLMAGYLPFDEPNLMTLNRRICKAEFSCPPWFSSSAKRLIKLILDPSPITRLSIADLLEDEWFKQGYKPPSFDKDDEDITIDDVDAALSTSRECLITERKDKPESMNAFELIFSSNQFSLEILYEN